MGIRLLTPIPGLLLGGLKVEDFAVPHLEDFNQTSGRFYQVVGHHAGSLPAGGRVRVK
jgi:hypothetical protein